MPKISVVMPVYNALPSVQEAIESILAQTYADFELLLVDDSTDATTPLLHALAKQDQRIRVLRGPGQGLTAALNAGIAAAQAELIARMDADDVTLPERFAKQVAFLRDHPDCDAVGTSVLVVDPDGEPMYFWNQPPTHEEIDRRHMQGLGGAIAHPSVMLRRSSLDKVGGYCERFQGAEDLDLFLRLAECGRLANLPDVLLRYRQAMAIDSLERYEKGQRCIAMAVREAHERRGMVYTPKHDLEFGAYDVSLCNRIWIRDILAAGNFGTARKHAWRYCRSHPCSWKSWGYLLIAALGPLGARLLKMRRLPEAADAD